MPKQRRGTPSGIGWPKDGPEKGTPERGQFLLDESVNQLVKDQTKRRRWEMVEQTLLTYGDFLENHPEAFEHMPAPQPTNRTFGRQIA